MSESAGQFRTEKYTDEFNNPPTRENLNTPIGLRILPNTSKSNLEPSIQKPSIRRNSVKASTASPPKSQPQKYYNGLTDKQKTEAYFDLYDQNIQLRSKQNELESQIKKLTTQLIRLTKDIKPGNSIELEVQNEELLKENKFLKSKLAALSSNKPKINRPGTALNKKPQIQARVIEKISCDYESELKEREEIITLLRDQLEATETELLRSKSKKVEFPDLSDEFREKAYRLAEVENKFLSLEESMTAQKIYSEHVIEMLESTKNTLKEERFKNCEMEFRLKAAEMAAAGAQDLAHKIKELEYEKSQLEVRIKEIIEAYFALEAGKGENPPHLPAPGIDKLSV